MNYYTRSKRPGSSPASLKYSAQLRTALAAEETPSRKTVSSAGLLLGQKCVAHFEVNHRVAEALYMETGQSTTNHTVLQSKADLDRRFLPMVGKAVPEPLGVLDTAAAAVVAYR